MKRKGVPQRPEHLLALDGRRLRALRAALRESRPGDRVSIHARTCDGDPCSCRPLRLVVGARA